MTQTSDQRRAPTHSLDGVILASLATTFLAPILAYTTITVVGAHSFFGVILGLYVAPFFLLVAPLAFAFIFLVSAALGWLLSFLEVRHIAFFMLAGAVVGVLAWFLEPMLVWGRGGLLFLSKDADVAQTALMMAGMAGAGMINGAIYWLVARRVSRKASRQPETLPPS